MKQGYIFPSLVLIGCISGALWALFFSTWPGDERGLVFAFFCLLACFGCGDLLAAQRFNEGFEQRGGGDV